MRSYLAAFSVFINERTGGDRADERGRSNSRPKLGGQGEVKTSPVDSAEVALRLHRVIGAIA